MMAASMINTDFIQKHPAQAVLTVLGLSGAVLIFLPFSDGEVPAVGFLDLLPPPLPPFGSFDELFWWLAPAVLFPFAISAGYLRWLLTGRLSHGEAWLGYALALLAACSLVLVLLVESLLVDWSVSYVYSLVAFGAGAGFVIQNLRTATPPVPNALVAMQVVYLPLALYWVLFAFLDGHVQIGFYLAIVTVLAYSAQIVMAAKRPWQTLMFFVPLSLVWVGSFVWAWLKG